MSCYSVILIYFSLYTQRQIKNAIKGYKNTSLTSS